MRRLVILLPLILTACLAYSDGDRSGVITKLSNKGIFCKTWEGSMNLGGMRNETRTSSDGKSSYDVTVPNTFDFTVEDLATLKDIQAAMDSGDRVTLHYHQELMTAPCRSNSNYFITGVKK